MSKTLLSVLKIALAILSIIFSAKLSFDLPLGETTIPITGQSLAVLCWAVFLRPYESVIAVGSYIALGIFGFPVFAGGTSGMEVMQGESGGYIVGFLIAALVVSWIRDPYRNESIFSLLSIMVLGTAIIIIAGMIRMSMLVGAVEAIDQGFWPFWKGAVVKIILGGIITYVIHLATRKIKV